VQSGDDKFTPAHEEFTFTTKNSEFDPLQCGAVTYIAKYENSPIEESTVLKYDSDAM
jgi:hypothetical protein